MRVLKDKKHYKGVGEIVVLRTSIKTRRGEIYHAGIFKVYSIYKVFDEIAYAFYSDGKCGLFELDPDMFYKAFRRAYKNEEKLWKQQTLKHSN